MRPDIVAGGRKQLVGLLTDDPAAVLVEGAQIVLDPRQPLPMKMVGHVTSSYWSATLGRSVAMALIEGGHGLRGTTVHIPMENRTLSAKVTDVTFYDAEGERLKV
jgi:sarcosine oxidase subunit alpha